MTRVATRGPRRPSRRDGLRRAARARRRGPGRLCRGHQGGIVAINNQQGSAGSRANYGRLVSTFGPSTTTVTDAPPFVANDVFDKVALLATIALVSGVATAIANPAPGLMWAVLIGAAICGFLGIFRPRQARIFAPIYAVAIGSVLGWVSRFYATGNGA